MIVRAAAVFFLFCLYIPGGYADDLPSVDLQGYGAGRHDMWVPLASSSTGRAISMPMTIIKGAQPGKILVLTAAVHGDELNGIRVLHRLAQSTDPNLLRGSLVLFPGVNGPAMRANSRYFPESVSGGSLMDLNRLFPGKVTGGLSDLVAAALWSVIQSLKPDLVIDLHTQTRGTSYPLFVYANMTNPVVRQMAIDVLPDLIKDDVGHNGTLETELMRAGIPAMTFEIGEAKRFQATMIDRALGGLKNVMRRHGFVRGSVLQALVPPFVGERFFTVSARKGGSVVIDVNLLDMVEKDMRVARQFDAFGHEIHAYYAPVSGHVVSVATDPLREPGAPLVRILY